ncbi:helix-turn-helix domain-containing protein [Thiobaca trueperi]|uniref:AraC-like DNA-binding protein n=1 Tax=Thiobaca trueperi TaxID=127458 RepID=A0A4R3N1P8_9GAMM|nr:helix-turn-helix domain-containing protein [Thiobaca trueperi]TCT22011.1 AraC-like DNA-binding protein [Thiobaca trueperi]
MQRLTTSTSAAPTLSCVSLGCDARALPSPRPCSLSYALRQGLARRSLPQIESAHPPHAVRSRTIGRIEMMEATGGALSIDTQGCLARAQVSALIQIEGRATASQGERTAEIGPGGLCLIRSGRPLELQFESPFRIVLIEAPEEEIADRFPLWRAAMLVPIQGRGGVPAIFRDAVSSLRRWQDSLNGTGSDGLADALINLMGALVCFAAPIAPHHARQSLHQKDRIKQVVQLNLRDPDLDVDRIAAFTGIPPRRIHRLFADEGMSLMRWVWAQRLEQCYRELMQDSAGGRSIGDIAYTWGFNDQAHFSRAFRKRFGISPREARRQSHLEIA